MALSRLLDTTSPHLFYCSLHEHSYIFAGERVSHSNVAFAVHLLQEIENIGERQVEEFELKLELAPLVGELMLEGFDFVEGRLQVPPSLVDYCQQP